MAAVRITLDSNARKIKRELLRIRRKAVFAAEKITMDDGIKLLYGFLVKEWARAMNARKTSFPRQVLRRQKSFVDFKSGELKRPARVRNTGADTLLRLQIEGGTRRPEGRALLITPQGKRPRKNIKTYTAGGYLFQRGKRIGSRYLGVFKQRARIPKRWRIERAIRRTEKVLPRVARRALARELARVRSRT